jgi:hypothetical protein
MAQIFYYSIPFESEEEISPDQVQHWIESHPRVRNSIRRGDILRLPSQYRNDGSFIWDGSNVQYLSSEDEYGNVPSDFLVLDEIDGPSSTQGFELDHWLRPVNGVTPIEHNDYVWFKLTPGEIEQIKTLSVMYEPSDRLYYLKMDIGPNTMMFVSSLQDFNQRQDKLTKPLLVSVFNQFGFGSNEMPTVMVDYSP